MRIDELARLIGHALKEVEEIQIEGLGTFRRGSEKDIVFDTEDRPRVFIAYASEDGAQADRLYEGLEAAGFQGWLDRRKLMPGQNWPKGIENAITESDYFIACFSRRSVAKRGTFQAEIRCALNCSREFPTDEIFLIPVRLEECVVPEPIQRETQYVDLFPDWESGLGRVVSMIRAQNAKRLSP